MEHALVPEEANDSSPGASHASSHALELAAAATQSLYMFLVASRHCFSRAQSSHLL